MQFYLLENEVDRVWVVLVSRATLRVRCLRQNIHFTWGMLRNTHSHRNVSAASFLQKTAQQTCPEMGVPPSAGNSQNLELRAAQCEPNRKGIINIVANVRVDDDFFGRLGARHRSSGLRG